MAFGVGDTVQNVFLAGLGATNAAKTGFVFAGRKLNANNQLQLPLAGNPMPSPYIPFNLGAYKSGSAAVAKLVKMGFNYVPGYSVTENLPAPDSIVTDNVTGLVDLVWNSTTTGLEAISGSNPTGSATQTATSASATIRNIVIGQFTTVLTVSMVTGSPEFNSSTGIIVNASILSSAPNPKLSDEVVVFAYWYYQKYAVSPNFTTSPNLWISTLITGRDTDINPTATPIDLVAPTAVAVLADSSVNLTYPLDADNLGLLPTGFFGGTSVTQATSGATATYNGYTISGTNVVINVTGVTGTFDTVAANTISIVLDTSRNGGTLTGKTEIGGYAMCYGTANTPTQLAASFPEFMALIAAKRDPAQVKNNQFNVQGYYGFIPSYIGQYPISQIYAPDSMAYVMTVKMDVTTAFQYPCTVPQIVAQSLFTDMMNEVPYLADAGESALLNVTVSTNEASIPDDETLELLVTQGVTPIGITANGLPYWYNRVNGLQTNQGTTDFEYRYQSVQLKKRWLDRSLEITNRIATQTPQGQRRNNDPLLIKNVESRGQNILQNGSDAGMLGTTNNTVDVQINPNNVTRLLETITTTIVSQNNGIDTVVYVYTFEG